MSKRITIFGADGLAGLDLAGVVVIFSVRKVNTYYTGNCIRVRRSSDSNELDVGFIGGSLDTASLLAFVGSGDGLVVKWYDQSGNGLDLEELTPTNQPVIVNVGNLLIRNSLPSINYTNILHDLITPTIPAGLRGTNGSAYFVCTFTGVAPIRRITLSNPSSFLLFADDGRGGASSVPGISQCHINNNLTNVAIRSDVRNAYLSYVDMLVSVNNYDFSGFSYFEIGRSGANITGLNNYQEVIIYSTDKTSNRLIIENNINNYFNIY